MRRQAVGRRTVKKRRKYAVFDTFFLSIFFLFCKNKPSNAPSNPGFGRKKCRIYAAFPSFFRKICYFTKENRFFGLLFMFFGFLLTE